MNNSAEASAERARTVGPPAVAQGGRCGLPGRALSLRKLDSSRVRAHEIDESRSPQRPSKP